ncbi:MAG TPA: hypothetical protein DCR43_00830 [Bacteroidales bacterium]|nr:MAG: hypothetical protein A2X11_14655 [Bacteroidetes bacterium GWE2_42_24]OFY31591.1 MAG: hypothetical protein A2X09_08395 [Bacteroidetes bacterium GWF2_43_11]HAQ64396.1 hypothetical protein [Bacteroidales bacterium]HBZ67154.1 hypothetical protein [Bacteroidales bacterium]
MNLEKLRKVLKTIILSLLPILLIVLGIKFTETIPFDSLNCVDPEMAYLYNGLSILHGHFPQFVDHPGIPMQYISAFLIQIVHFFRDGNIDKDVIQNPNVYIHVIPYTFISLNALALFFTGLLTMNFFKRFSKDLFIELTPFISLIFINLSSRIIPEYFSLMISLLFFIITVCYIYATEKGGSSNKRSFPLLYAIAIGFAISTKVTFATFIIIPFLILKSPKEKIRFVVYSAASLIIFILPAFNRFSYFARWVLHLFLNSGSYGQGDANFVDTNLYNQNLLEIFNSDPILIALLLVFVVGILLYTIFSIKNKQRNSVLFRAFITFSMVTMLTVLIIAKQLKLYYLSPAYCMAVPSLFLGLLLLERSKSLIINQFALATIVLFPILFYYEVMPSFEKFDSILKDREVTYKALGNKYDHLPIANASIYYGSPFYGYPATYGNVYSSEERQNEIRPFLNHVAPSFYTYLTWDNQFHDWRGKSHHFNNVLSMHDSIYLYLGDLSESSRFEAESLGMNIKMENSIRREYINTKTNEAFYLFKRKKQEYSNWQIDCDIEHSNEDYLQFTNNLKTTGFQSNDFERSGLLSCKLDKNHQYGLSILLTDVNKGEKYTISVWKYEYHNTKTCLVLSSVKQNLVYIANSSALEEKDGWGKIELQFTVDDKFQNEDFKIYCWQAEDNEPSYWDDLNLRRSTTTTIFNKSA